MRHYLAIALFSIFCIGTSSGQDTPAAGKPATPPADKANFHLYLLIGQSNMAGRDTRDLESQKDSPRVLAYDQAGNWVIARDPMHPVQGRTQPGAGPGIPFAKEMIKADPKITIGLVPCAVGGSPLKDWVKGAKNYQAAMERIKIAQQAGTLKGVLWLQGETDTQKVETAAVYEEKVIKMFGDLRAELAQPELPIVVGQIGEFLAETPAKYPGYVTVSTAIAHLTEVVPHLGFANSKGLTDKGDKLHYDAKSQKVMGERFAKAMLALQKK